MKELGVTIYPVKDFDLDKNKEYVLSAHHYGYTRIFISFFCVLPQEIAETDYLCKIKDLADYAKSLNMKVQADFFSDIFNAFNATSQNISTIISAGIDEIRIDGGFDFSEIAQMSLQNCRRIVINASELANENGDIINIEKTIEKGLQEFLDAGGDITKIEASHNMYPHEGTGLSMNHLINRKSIFKKYHIPISAFCNSHTFEMTLFHAMDGSPTVEDHRSLSAYGSAHELFVSQTVDSVFIADGFVSKNELSSLTRLLEEDIVSLRVGVYPMITQQEKDVLFSGVHSHRESAYCMRSMLYRELVKIPPRHTIERHCFDVTIDNEDYERYFGEVQILLKDRSINQRVNVVGYIVDEDRPLLKWIQSGQKFQFIEEKK